MSAPAVGEHGAAVRPVAVAVLGSAAIVGGALAMLGAWGADDVGKATAGLLAHVLAALAARAAGRAGGGAGSELDLVLVLAIALPVFGPALAWTLPLGRATAGVENAHAAFEAAERRAVPRRQHRQLDRELGVVSHAQVLQHGSLEEKRNLLRRIARLGDAHYLTLLRQFLRDPEPELRLCAYSELARSCQAREQGIARLRREADGLRTAATDDQGRAALAAALAELADADRGYAASGLLDADMADYWLRQAEDLGWQALAVDGGSRAAERVLALVLAESGDVERAWSIAAEWSATEDTALQLARAEIAFRRRDRATCRSVAEVLQLRGLPLPAWLAAVVGGEVVRAGPAAEANA